MHIFPPRIGSPELITDSLKRLRQAGITRLLDIWADAVGLTVKAVVPDAPLDTFCVPITFEIAIINIGGGSVEDTQHQALIESVRKLMPQVPLVIISDREDPREVCAAFRSAA
jgi:DNA-binding NarL/FixJ family response regulator